MHARIPVLIAIIQAAAGAVRRDFWHVAAVLEARIDEIVLRLDAPDTAPHPPDVILALQLGTEEVGVALRVSDLIERRPGGAAGHECVAATHTGEILEDEVLELCVVDRRLETELALVSLQTEFDRVALLDVHVRIADL